MWNYSLVSGNTTGFPMCEKDCTYIRDDQPGILYCFEPGPEPVTCFGIVSTFLKFELKTFSLKRPLLLFTKEH